MNKINYKLLFQRAKVLAWFYLITIFLIKILGVNVITLENYNNIEIFKLIDNNLVLKIIIQVCLGTGAYNIIYFCAMEKYAKVIFKINLLLIPYFIFLNVLINNSTNNVIIGIVSVIGYLIPFIKYNHLDLDKYIVLFFIDLIFQTISLVTKDVQLITLINKSSISIITSMDYYTLWLIYFLNKIGGTEVWRGSELVCYFSAKKRKSLHMKLRIILNYYQKQLTTLRKNICKIKLIILLKNLRCWIKFELPIKLKEKILPFAAFLIIYLGFAIIQNKVIESVMLFISYGSFRFIYPKQFHADYIPNIKSSWISFVCVMLSSFTLCTALYNTVYAEFSILSSIVVAFILDWILYVIRDWLDYQQELPFIIKLKKLFTPKEYWKDKLTTNGFKYIHFNIVNLYVFKKQTMQQVSIELGYSLQTCRNYFGEVTKVFPELKKNNKK